MLAAGPIPKGLTVYPGGQTSDAPPAPLQAAWLALQEQQARRQRRPTLQSRSSASRRAVDLPQTSNTPVQLPLQSWSATPAQIRAWQKRGQLALPGKGGVPGNVALLLQALRADAGIQCTFSGLDHKPLPRDLPLSKMVVLAGIAGDTNTATALGLQLARIMKTYSPGDMPVRLFGTSMSLPITGPAVFHHALGNTDGEQLTALRYAMQAQRQQVSDLIFRVAQPALNPVEASLLNEQDFLDMAAPLIENLSDRTLRDSARKLLAAYAQTRDSLVTQSKIWWRNLISQLAQLRDTLQRAGGASLLAVPANEVRTFLQWSASDSEMQQLAGAFLGMLQLSERA